MAKKATKQNQSKSKQKNEDLLGGYELDIHFAAPIVFSFKQYVELFGPDHGAFLLRALADEIYPQDSSSPSSEEH